MFCANFILSLTSSIFCVTRQARTASAVFRSISLICAGICHRFEMVRVSVVNRFLHFASLEFKAALFPGGSAF